MENSEKEYTHIRKQKQPNLVGKVDGFNHFKTVEGHCV